MNNTKQRIQKITSKGQMTLPVAWRKKINTNIVIVETKGDILEISPARLQKENGEYTVFDAIRDNKGKGIKAEDLVNILKKVSK